jgi:integrase
MKKLRYVHHKTAKGRTYVYFDTGQRTAEGRKILKRLPDERDPAFPRAYMMATEARKRRSADVPLRTFDGMVTLFEKSPDFRQLSRNSQRSYSHYLAKASALLRDGQGRSAPAAEITAEDVCRIRDTLANGGGANQAVRSISALYAWAMKPGRKYAEANPAKGVDKLDEDEHDPWPEWLVEEGLADATVRLPVALLYFTGQRIGDVCAMRWTDIRGGAIEVTTQKTDTALAVPLVKELADLLAETPKRAMTILANSEGQPWTTSGLRQLLQSWAKAKGQIVVPHGLRKNAVNALIEAGCSTAEVNGITGQDLKTIEHYAKKRDRSKLGRAAIVKLEDARKARNKART